MFNICQFTTKELENYSTLFKFQMKLYNKFVRRIVKNWPGKKYFGIYRFLPVFFVTGAALEFSMINWQVGETNFYKIYKKRRAEEIVAQKLGELSP